MRRRTLIALLCVLLTLTGCVSNLPAEKQSDGAMLPDVRVGPESPIGDSQSARDVNMVLYLPDADVTRLVATVRKVTVQPGQSRYEACMEALLDVINVSDFHSGYQQLRLAPVSNPVESSGELVTVNMHTTARSLEDEAIFALRVAIANTLTELPGTNYVNVLINGRDIGLDFTGTLPTGVMARYPSGDISTYWGLMDTQVKSVDAELQKVAALYFLSEDGGSLLSELRNIVFPVRDTAKYAARILEELTISTQEHGIRTVVPTSEWFDRDPVFVRAEGASMGHIELYFSQYIDDFLMLHGNTRGMLLSSICYTLTSFIPQLEGIIAYVDGEMITEVELMDGSDWTAANGLMRREDFASLAADTCTVFYPLADHTGIRAVKRPIAQRLRTQPRALLREMMKPPETATLTNALPIGTTDADVLGLKIDGDTALINLSESFAQACRDLSDVEERNLVYCIVNTLTEIDGVNRVRFFVNGQVGVLAKHLFMEGEFMRHMGIVR